MSKIEISITGETEEFFKTLRDRKEFKSMAEAVEYALPIAASRIKATFKYAKGHKPAAKPRKAAAPKAKKTSAKGPLARKAASKAKAPTVRKAKSESAPSATTAPAPASTPTAPVLD